MAGHQEKMYEPYPMFLIGDPVTIMQTKSAFVEINIEVVQLGDAEYVYVGTINQQLTKLKLDDIWQRKVHGACNHFDPNEIWVKSDAVNIPSVIIVTGELYQN